jgi:hypothetical protein
MDCRPLWMERENQEMIVPDKKGAYADLMEELANLRATALKVKAERDYAIELLRISLMYSFTGGSGDFKDRVRAFLETLKGK